MPKDLAKVKKLKLSIIALISVLGLAMVSLIPLLVNNLQQRNDLDKHLQSIKQVTQDIIYYDEVLTMSARMYVFTHNPYWEKRYNTTAKKLDNALFAAQQLEPKVMAAIQATSIINDQLVSLELNSMEQIKNEHFDHAQKILLSNQYFRLKEEYSRFVFTALEEAVHHNEVVLLDKINKTKNWLLIAAFFLSVLFFSLVIYFYIYNKKTEAVITSKIQDLNAKVQELEDLAIELDTANNAKSELLAKVSHELKTPINGIHGSLQLIKSYPLDEQTAELAEHAILCSDMLVAQVDDILDFSKLKAGKYQLNLEEFNLIYLLNSVELLYEQECREKGIEFQLSHNLQHLQRLGDYLRLKQLVFNLLNNAVKFTHKGKVAISIQELDASDEVLIEVSDTGIGMTETTVANLFNEFEQADSSITRRFGGTGLGMSIVKSLVDLMDGHIHVSSKFEVGTQVTIKLRLPVTNAPTPSAPMKPKDHLGRLKNLDVLVAEDNRVNQLIIVKLLEGVGIHAVVKSNGREAVEAVTPETKLVLMDIQMPVMDGVTACQHLKHIHPNLPIVAVTANVQDREVDLYMSKGFDDVVSKPINMDKLYETLYKHIRLG